MSTMLLFIPQQLTAEKGSLPKQADSGCFGKLSGRVPEASAGRWGPPPFAAQVVLDAGALPAEVTLGMKDTSNAEPEAEAGVFKG